MWRTPDRPAIESSITRVTWTSISAGAAPGRAAVTETRGKSMSGLLLIRIPMKPVTPARVSNRNSRMMGMGFLMAQEEI
ncbi:hypothetical protein D3C72_1307310 [compost metagenome]